MSVLTVSSGGVPVGNYTGTFSGTEPQPENRAKGYGPGLRWKFVIEGGPQAGQTASRVTGLAPSPKNACGKMLAGLIGRPLKEGETIDPDQYIGRRYMIIVAAGQDGGTRVEVVTPIASS
jgi:hypothetical protein